MSFRFTRSASSINSSRLTESISIGDDESAMTVSITKTSRHTPELQAWIDLFVELLEDDDFATAFQESTRTDEPWVDVLIHDTHANLAQGAQLVTVQGMDLTFTNKTFLHEVHVALTMPRVLNDRFAILADPIELFDEKWRLLYKLGHSCPHCVRGKRRVYHLSFKRL